jgi:signal transduction histidine kinase
MAATQRHVGRELLVAVLVLMTLLPLVVYLYLRQRGREQAVQRLIQDVARTASLAPRLTSRLGPLLEEAGPRSDAVTEELERLVMSHEPIAYIQLCGRTGGVLSSTSGAPLRDQVPRLRDLPLGSPDVLAPNMAEQLASAQPGSAPEFVMDVRLGPEEPGFILFGLSVEAVHRRLRDYQAPEHLSALQISILCVAILAVFSACIFHLHRRTQSLHAQLEQERRLAYIGTLASSIAHELRNPLSSVRMNAQMLQRTLDELPQPDTQSFRRKLQRIQTDVDRLDDSIGHFLSFARPQPTELTRANLNAVVEQALGLLEPQVRNHAARVVRRLARDLPAVRLDPRQVAQAVENLVLNAIQACPNGGTVAVETAAQDDTVAITVTDNGPGIPPDVRERIFDVFFTTREDGTGLGLNIVQRIVEEHRGKLSVDSEPGRGSTFRIELPTHPRAEHTT